MPTDTLVGKRIALIVLTRTGLQLALHIKQELEADLHIYASQRVSKTQAVLLSEDEDQENGCDITYFASIKALLRELWQSYEQLVLYFALGAAVRLIAPLLQDKHSDPGVVVIDDAGQFAISVVSGHLGGANDLATRCAHILGAVPVITTASDIQHTLAIDLLAQANGWYIEETSALTATAAAIVNGEQVAVFQDPGNLSWSEYDQEGKRLWPENLVPIASICDVTPAAFAALLVLSDRLITDLPTTLPTVVCRPPTLVLGIGCRRGVPFAALDTWIKEILIMNRIAFKSVAVLASAEIKADEEGLQLLAQHYGWSFEVHSVESLQAVTVLNPSERVQQLVGTPSVSEAAALLSSQGGKLLVPKHKGEGMTVAVARKASLSIARQQVMGEQQSPHTDIQGQKERQKAPWNRDRIEDS